jgi:hypothetical protein
VTYRITGNGAPVQVTYRDVAGASVSQVAPTLPWEMSFEGRASAPLYVSGVGQGPANVSLACEILVDGHPRSQSMSVGSSAVATCSAPLP